MNLGLTPPSCRRWRGALPCWLAALLSLVLAAPVFAASSIEPGDAAALQSALNGGGVVTFNSDGETTLNVPLVVATNATLDGAGRNVSLSGNANITTNTVVTTNIIAGNTFITNITTITVVTNDPVTGAFITNQVPQTNISFTLTTTTNITTNLVINATGTRLFNINPGVQLTLLNLTLTKGLSQGQGGAISNAGTLLVSNCLFAGNSVLGLAGTNGTDGVSRLGTGGNASGGLNGGTVQGGALYNVGTAILWQTEFLTNQAIGGQGGAGGRGGDGDWSGGNGASGGLGGAAQGGAIYSSGQLEMRACFISDSTATGGNGGVGGTNGTGPVSSGLSGRGGAGGQGAGAGLYNVGTARLEACTFAFNDCTGGDSRKAGSPEDSSLRTPYPGGDALGAAIFNLGTNSLVNCTLYFNRAAGGRGGDGGDAQSSSLFRADGANGGNGWGGGLYSARWAALTNCTLSDNSAAGGTNGLGGSGLFPGSAGHFGNVLGGNLANNNGTVYLKSSLIVHTGGGANAFGSVTDTGYNLSSDLTPVFSAAGSRTNLDPQIGFLEDNGGPTVGPNGTGGTLLTLALSNSSPALNAGDPTSFPPTDARGIPRPQGGRADIGAFELEAINLQGRVTADRVGLAGVMLTAGTDTTTTDATGFYAFTNLALGTYTVLPALDGFVFSPPIRSVTVGGTPTNVNFTATGIFAINGRVTLDGLGLSGVAVTSGPRTATTDGSGFYSLPNLGPGNRAVTAALAGYAFIPASQTVTLGTADANGVDFGAVRVFSVRGTVFTEITGAGKSNVEVIATSTATALGQTLTVSFTNRSDANGNFVFTNVPAGALGVLPSLAGFSFIPDLYTATLAGDLTGLSVVAFASFTISGQVTLDGVGFEGVTVTAGGDGVVDFSTETDALGFYTLSNLTADFYEVAADLPGYAFAPSFANPVTVGPNASNINFAASPALSISGVITENGAGVSNVSVAVGSAVVLTDAAGFYQVSGLAPDVYTVTPYLARNAFTPASRSVALLGDSVAGQDFTAAPLCNINGRVTWNSAGLSGVTLSAGGKTATTDSNGYYSLVSVPGGSNVLVTPTRGGYGFTPASRSLVLSGNTNNVDFAATQLLQISGRLTEGTSPVTNVVVWAGGVTNRSDAGGNYVLAGLMPGSYTVTPNPAGVGFNPAATNVTLGTFSLTGVNFSANPPRLAIALSNALPKLTLTALPLRSYTLQFVTNFPPGTNWQTALTLPLLTATNGVVSVVDSGATNKTARFYRATAP